MADEFLEKVMSRNWILALVAAFTALTLAACSDNVDDLCDAPASHAGSPDITASPSFSAPSVTAGNTVTVSVPVDGDTQTVVVDFAASGDTATLDNAGLTDIILAGGTLGAQTVDVDVTVPLGTAAGSYYPVILLCSGDVLTCASVVAYAEDPTALVSQDNYVRGTATYDNATGATSFDSSSISNSCVGVSALVVNSP